MPSDSLASAIEALQADASAKSETARLREVFGSIEKALASGVKREALLATLHKEGFTMTMNGLRSALQRIRQENRT